MKILERFLKPRTIIALMMYGVFSYCIINGITVPPLLAAIISSLTTFWFAERMARRGIRAENK